MNIANTELTKEVSTFSGLLVCYGGYSCAGKKAVNQDAFAALTPNENEQMIKGIVATIADGVSSASKAAEAAQLATTQFISEYYATPETWSTQHSASKVITGLNQWLYSQQGVLDVHYPQQQWLTTFSALILKSATGYVFHVGDSRISRFRDGQIEAITRDHNRKQGGQQVILTRALGAESRLQVDAHTVDLQSGDVYMLTCDGIHDFLSSKAIRAHLSTVSSDPDNAELEHISKRIVEHAISIGSDDNVSCLLVYVKDVPRRKLDEIERDILNQVIPPALHPGMRLDDFLVRKVIHASTRSHLYLVEHIDWPDPVVLKAPSANLADDAIYLQGFMREAWVGERIKHDNVMKIERRRSKSKFTYLLCEYIEGQTLSQWIYDNPGPTIAQVRDIINQIISALRALQRLELVHRDLKPDNIMIDLFGQVKLIDYGTVFVASLDENQQNLSETVPQGSLNYIAPETLLHMNTDYRSDLFSLGIICYELLCGELPFKPMVRAEITFKDYAQWRYRSIRAFRPELPAWLDIALKRATQPDPDLRYQAFSEFYADLNKPNTNAVDQYQRLPFIRRHPVKFWKSVSLVLFIAFLIALFT